MVEYANEYVLDLHDAGYWMIRLGTRLWPAGVNKAFVQSVIQSLNESHSAQIEHIGGSLYVFCYDDHSRLLTQLVIKDVYGTPIPSPANSATAHTPPR